MSLRGAPALEDGEWFLLFSLGTHEISPDEVPLDSSSEWSGLPAPELTAVRVWESLSPISGAINSVMRWVVARRWSPRSTTAQFGHDKQLCVAQQRLHGPFSSACIFES